MAGRILPANRPRNPPQQTKPSATPARVWTTPTWRTGDKVLWNGYTGTFLRETVDNHAGVLIGTRTYRLPKVELQST
jgi:hypothetical protein